MDSSARGLWEVCRTHPVLSTRNTCQEWLSLLVSQARPGSLVSYPARISRPVKWKTCLPICPLRFGFGWRTYVNTVASPATLFICGGEGGCEDFTYILTPLQDDVLAEGDHGCSWSITCDHGFHHVPQRNKLIDIYV